MFKYWLICILGLFGGTTIYAQTPAPKMLPFYEERDTLVFYKEGLYAEKITTNRVLVDASFIDELEQQSNKRNAQERERVKVMRQRMKEKQQGSGGKKQE